MKAFFHFITLLVTILLMALNMTEGENEGYVEITLSPKVQQIDTNGNVEYLTKNLHRRFIRAPSTCRIPSALENSQLKCKLYPSKVECNQTCIFGHTLREGVNRHMRCKYDEDKWYPSKDFEKCKPFVDCNLSYGPGAFAKCYTNYMDKGPSCEVRCEPYEDKEAVPEATYRCDIQGRWTPKLPFCVKAGSGEKLAPPPRGR